MKGVVARQFDYGSGRKLVTREYTWMGMREEHTGASGHMAPEAEDIHRHIADSFSFDYSFFLLSIDVLADPARFDN